MLIAGRCIVAVAALMLWPAAALASAAPRACAPAVASPSAVLFVTDRQRATDAQLFTGERAPQRPPLSAGALGPGAPARALSICARPQDLIDALRSRFDPKRGRQIIVYVHGYFTSFRAALTTAAGLQSALAFPGPLVVYSWPARSTSVLAYATDEKNAGWAIPHFQAFLRAVERTYPGLPISFAAHSLGSRFLTAGITALGANGCTKCFGRAVAFAPDEDPSTLRSALAGAGLCGGAPHAHPLHAAPVTLYVSNRDRALRLSQRFHGGRQRAGQAGSALVLCSGVDTIDVSYYKSTDPLGHSYELDPAVTADARAALAGFSPAAPARKLKPATRPGGTYYELGRE